MAEIYTSAASASQGHLSPDASDHINSVLSDLGLGGTTGDSSGTAHSSTVSTETTTDHLSTTTSASHDTSLTASTSQSAATDHGSTILVGSTHDAQTASTVSTDATDSSSASDTLTAHTTASTASEAPAFAASAVASGADSLHGSHAAFGSDAFGGFGTDTLWGSDGGGNHTAAATSAAHAGGDTIRSSGGMETIYGGNATIYASGHSATLSTDTVHASGDGTTMDGSASPQTLHTDGASSFAHLPGGSGSDTIVLHDTTAAGQASTSPEEPHSPYGYGFHDDPAATTHDATYLGYGSPDSVVGGDGSDHFALLGYDGGAGAYDTGAGDDGSAAQDPYHSGGQVTHSDAGTFVSYHDGYGTGYSDTDHHKFKDTVMAG